MIAPRRGRLAILAALLALPVGGCVVVAPPAYYAPTAGEEAAAAGAALGALMGAALDRGRARADDSYRDDDVPPWPGDRPGRYAPKEW